MLQPSCVTGYVGTRRWVPQHIHARVLSVRKERHRERPDLLRGHFILH